jgi:hypothetical protein
MMVWLQSRGISCRTHIKKGFGNCNDSYRLIIPNQNDLQIWQNNVPNLSSIKKVDVKLKKSKKTTSKEYMASIISVSEGVLGDVFDLQVDDVHEYLADGFVTHNSGKSYDSIAICKLLDPNFSVDNIYFDYNDLINNRHKLKPNTAVLVDEQSEAYGIDSHRVSIILNALKEQLRKKSIHFIFCSPTLKDESRSSMYVLETMFIDYEESISYAAYKTRELLTLGYVKIPHPLMVGVTKEFLKAYEKKKDAHLELLTGGRTVDDVEDRANLIIASDVFKKAENVYVNKMGYVPSQMVHQIISVMFPDFKGSIIVSELAARIKFKKEMSGEWEISGVVKKVKKDGI